jgi:hypothetical protein
MLLLSLSQTTVQCKEATTDYLHPWDVVLTHNFCDHSHPKLCSTLNLSTLWSSWLCLHVFYFSVLLNNSVCANVLWSVGVVRTYYIHLQNVVQPKTFTFVKTSEPVSLLIRVHNCDNTRKPTILQKCVRVMINQRFCSTHAFLCKIWHAVTSNSLP